MRRSAEVVGDAFEFPRSRRLFYSVVCLSSSFHAPKRLGKYVQLGGCMARFPDAPPVWSSLRERLHVSESVPRPTFVTSILQPRQCTTRGLNTHTASIKPHTCRASNLAKQDTARSR